MPYHLQKNDINRSLEGFDEYKREKRLPQAPATLRIPPKIA
jgi:hypothetical protein